MKNAVFETSAKNALLVPPISPVSETRLATVSNLPVPQSRSLQIELVAPKFQALRVEAWRVEEERRRAAEEKARRDRESLLETQRKAQQAVFTRD